MSDAPTQPTLFSGGADDDRGGELTLRALESHLWGAADILRGAIDAGDFKHYILSLLFYKRLCDVWEDEYAEALEEFEGDEAEARHPDEHRFDLPEGYRWEEITAQSVHVGQTLTQALRAVEQANPALEGVFQDVDFGNTDRFPDHLVEQLLQHFSRYRLGRDDVAPDVLGDAYEYLISQFAENAGKSGGEFYTPRAVVQLMVRLLDPREGHTVYDPTCGSGGMLIGCAERLRREGKNPRALRLFGQERNINTWAICKMNLLLHDLSGEVARGDTLRDPQFFDASGALMTFDRVIANPPFSLKKWGHELWSKGDPHGRILYACPTKSRGDLAFVQHMVASLKPGGRLACVVPHGVLFRGGREQTIRRGLLDDDLLDAVIGLGPNLFYGTSIPAAILLIEKDRPAARRGHALIVNGEKVLTEGRNQNHLSTEDVEHLAVTVEQRADVDLLARLVPFTEIKANAYNLNLSRYVQTDPPPPPIDVSAEVRTLHDLIAQRDDAESKMNAFLEELNYV